MFLIQPHNTPPHSTVPGHEQSTTESICQIKYETFEKRTKTEHNIFTVKPKWKITSEKTG